MEKTLEYYYDDGSHVKFDKYTIDAAGVVRNKKTGRILIASKIGEYSVHKVSNNDGKTRSIRLARAIASTFHGMPPTLSHTADHMDRNPNNDILENVRWLCKKGQIDNQCRQETMKTAFVIVKDGIEKTAKEWFIHLRDEKNPFGRYYTKSNITSYAQKKQHGFAYKKYPDLEGEIWKEITGSKTITGSWQISDMCRVKYITKYAENVLSDERIGLMNGYPTIHINEKRIGCHIVVFATFFPDEYAARKSDEIILHEDGDKLDFRPHKLRLGTQSENIIDAYNNGCYDDTMSARGRCISYVNGIYEKEYESQYDAERYLKTIGYEKASQSKISMALSENRKTAYGRTWKLST